MTTTPTAHHLCQCRGRSGTREFINVGTDRWECANDTAGNRETVDVEYHPDEQHPFQVWVRSWDPNHALTSQSEGGAFDTSPEAANQSWPPSPAAKKNLRTCDDHPRTGQGHGRGTRRGTARRRAARGVPGVREPGAVELPACRRRRVQQEVMANRLTEEPVMSHEQFTYGCRCLVATIIVSFVASFELGARGIQYCFVLPTYGLLRLVIRRIPGIWRPLPVWPSTQWRQRLDRYLDREGWQ